MDAAFPKRREKEITQIRLSPQFPTTPNGVSGLAFVDPITLTFSARGGKGGYSWSVSQTVLLTGQQTYTNGTTVTYPGVAAPDNGAQAGLSANNSSASFFDSPGAWAYQIPYDSSSSKTVSASILDKFVTQVTVTDTATGQSAQCPTILWTATVNWFTDRWKCGVLEMRGQPDLRSLFFRAVFQNKDSWFSGGESSDSWSLCSGRFHCRPNLVSGHLTEKGLATKRAASVGASAQRRVGVWLSVLAMKDPTPFRWRFVAPSFHIQQAAGSSPARVRRRAQPGIVLGGRHDPGAHTGGRPLFLAPISTSWPTSQGGVWDGDTVSRQIL